MMGILKDFVVPDKICNFAFFLRDFWILHAIRQFPGAAHFLPPAPLLNSRPFHALTDTENIRLLTYTLIYRVIAYIVILGLKYDM